MGFLRHDVSLGVDLLHHAVLIRQPANPSCKVFLRQHLELISNLVQFPGDVPLGRDNNPAAAKCYKWHGHVFA